MKTTQTTLSGGRPAVRGLFHGLVGAWALLLASGAGAAESSLEETRALYATGRYQECIAVAQAAIADGAYQEDWPLILTDAYLATGEFTNALQTVEKALNRFSSSIRIPFQARIVYAFNGRPDRARTMLNRIAYLMESRMWAYRDPPNMVALGRAALLLGADPRQVLEQIYDQAKKRDGDLRDVYLASGELALDKNDYELAATVFGEGLSKLPGDPDLHLGLARAFAPSDRLRMIASLNTALSLNTNHTDSYLLLADHLLDGEEYESAGKALDDALRVNPWLPRAWSYKAVLAHLRNDADAERQARDKGLRYWTNNPAVDHLIGRKLSQKYRFDEGASYQRTALLLDPYYLPAKIQLAQDLMRLGQEEEGWRLAEQVSQADEYDVTAFNLVTLKEGLDDFQSLTNRDFILRMGRNESAIYGRQALELLQRAKDTLCAKYGMELERPTIVEIFPNQNDFGVRTFGMPHNPGFLGVCFGSVITANSPASQGGNPSNWEAVLWHEFCHVVTLQMTRNKMPRWLSEGISVYEELQQNPTWGQIMNPRYREMVLEGELTPVGELSAAFLSAPSDMHMQFAYYESCLVVQFLVQQFGMDSLKNILRDLGQGTEINAAIQRHTTDLPTLEKDFAAYAIAKAEALGPGLKWDRPDPDELLQARPEWFEKHSKNYYVLLRRTETLLQHEQWEEAKAPLQTLLDLYPDQIGPSSAYMQMALVHRKLGETEQETQVLKKLVIQDGDALDAYQRLMDLGREAEDWKLVLNNADRYLAVNPMVTAPHRYRAQAAEALQQDELAIQSLEILLRLEVNDLADVHYRLARLKHKKGDPAAKRHVLQALEEAPRFREALQLLLEMRPPKDSS